MGSCALILDNEYHSPEFRYFTRPLQSLTGWLPPNEWKAAWFSSNLIRAERRWPLYRNWLFQQLRNNPPDVLHAHFAPVGCHYLEMAKRLDIPLVASFYGFDYERLPFEKPAYRKRYKQLFEGAAAITTTGTFTPELLIKQGCPSEKIKSLLKANGEGSEVVISVRPKSRPGTKQKETREAYFARLEKALVNVTTDNNTVNLSFEDWQELASPKADVSL